MSRIRRVVRVGPGLQVVLLLLGPAIAGAQSSPVLRNISMRGTLEIDAGQFGFELPTTLVITRGAVSFSSERLDLALEAPVAWATTPWISITGAVLVATGGPQHALVAARSGYEELALQDTAGHRAVAIADPIATVRLRIWDEGTVAPAIRLVAAVKVPLGTTRRGYATGGTDLGWGSRSRRRWVAPSRLPRCSTGRWRTCRRSGCGTRRRMPPASAFPSPPATLPATSAFADAPPVVRGERHVGLLGIGFCYRCDSGRSIGLGMSLGLSEGAPGTSSAIHIERSRRR